MEAAGYSWNARWNKVVAQNERPIQELLRTAREAGMTLMTWRHDCSGGNTNEVGVAFATPVSDGRHIWTATAWGGFFCHDLDGTQRWVAFSPGQAGEYCRNGRSPILWNNLLISDITNRVRAFEASTGRLLWQHDINAHTIVSPAVLEVNGHHVLWTAGPNAYLLPDGRPLTIDGWKDEGMQILVAHDQRNVAFFCGSGEHCGWTNKGNADPAPPAAVRFSLNGQTLSAEVLWHGGTAGAGNRDFAGGNKPWMFYLSGRFYHINGGILNAGTGELVQGRIARRHNNQRAVPPTDHLLLSANGHLYGLTSRGLLSVFTLDGRTVADLTIETPQTSYEFTLGEPRFAGSDGPAFTLGPDAIFVRSQTHLHRVVGR